MIRALILAAGLLYAVTAAAHGVSTTVTNGPAVIVTVTLDDGSPLTGVAWSVTAPDNAAPRRNGLTDAAGRIVFLPEVPGEWEVMVSGADGHGTSLTVTVTADMLASGGSGSRMGGSQQLIIGVIFLLLVFGLATRFLTRRT